MLDAMLTEKRIMIQELQDSGPFSFNPIHDVEGDCGTTLALLVESETIMRLFLSKLVEAGIKSSTPIDSGRHVYTNWEPVLEKQGSHNPAFNAYQLAPEAANYSADMCPVTLDTLSRTIFLYTDPQRSREDLDTMIASVKQVAAEL
jgi:hypothetical protein